MVLGQCADKSVVILHCTPNAGVQISGTPTPDGTYGSQAIKLAELYMAKYPDPANMIITNQVVTISVMVLTSDGTEVHFPIRMDT